MAEPARIKLYGMFSTTRRAYRRQLIAALLCAAVGVGVWVVYWLPKRGDSHDLLPPATVALLNALPTIILAIVALQLIEAYFVFRLFRRREAASSPGSPPHGDAAQPALPEAGAGHEGASEGNDR